MIKQRKYNQTEIGRIPKEWKVVKLKDWKNINLIMGQSPPGKSYNRKGREEKTYQKQVNEACERI